MQQGEAAPCRLERHLCPRLGEGEALCVCVCVCNTAPCWMDSHCYVLGGAGGHWDCIMLPSAGWDMSERLVEGCVCVCVCREGWG